MLIGMFADVGWVGFLPPYMLSVIILNYIILNVVAPIPQVRSFATCVSCFSLRGRPNLSPGPPRLAPLQRGQDQLRGGRSPGANVIKLFTAVIYHHSMVILSFCVIKLYYPENYCRVVVNYHGILTLEKVG